MNALSVLHVYVNVVTNPPTVVTAMRTKYNAVALSWTAPASNMPPVAGYEAFYSLSGDAITQSETTKTTDATLTELMLGNTYNFFVVAYSDAENSLPSARSDNQTVEMGEDRVPKLNFIIIIFHLCTHLSLSLSISLCMSSCALYIRSA